MVPSIFPDHFSVDSGENKLSKWGKDCKKKPKFVNEKSSAKVTGKVSCSIHFKYLYFCQ